MSKVVGFWAKTYSYLIDDGSEDKKVKAIKKCVINRKLENYKNCLKATQLENKINYLEKNKINIVLKNHKKLWEAINQSSKHSKDLTVEGKCFYWRN